MRTRKLATVAAGAAALGLFLSACGGGDDSDDSTDRTDESSEQREDTSDDDADSEDTSSGDTESEDAESDDTASEDTEADDAAAGGGGAECLIGTWTASGDDLEAQVAGMTQGAGDITVEGEATVTIDETTYTQEADMESEGEVQGQEFSTDFDGFYAFSYTATDDTITWDALTDSEGSVQMVMGGQTIDMDLAETAAALEGQEVNYECTDTELSITVEGSGAQVFTRVS